MAATVIDQGLVAPARAQTAPDQQYPTPPSDEQQGYPQQQQQYPQQQYPQQQYPTNQGQPQPTVNPQPTAATPTPAPTATATAANPNDMMGQLGGMFGGMKAGDAAIVSMPGRAILTAGER